jgi:hypothetical protein
MQRVECRANSNSYGFILPNSSFRILPNGPGSKEKFAAHAAVLMRLVVVKVFPFNDRRCAIQNNELGDIIEDEPPAIVGCRLIGRRRAR